MTPQRALQRGLEELGLALPEAAQGQLLGYLALLEKWNRVYNLTAIREPVQAVSHHLLDSLAVAPHLPMAEESPRLADVGSGAGLPGLVLAIAKPHWLVTLNDANQKRVAFLRQAAIELAVPNVRVHEGRAEAWSPAPRFAVVISRAFAEWRTFLAACRHLVQPGGVLAAMMGAAPADTGEARVVRLRVPLLEAQRHLVLWPL